jgi:hypothetical protein
LSCEVAVRVARVRMIVDRMIFFIIVYFLSLPLLSR